MDIKALKKQVESQLEVVKTEIDCSNFYQKFLSKSGLITQAMSLLRDMTPEQRTTVGAELNSLKRDTEMGLRKLQAQITANEINKKLMTDELIDITIPKIEQAVGCLHPITRVMDEVIEAFASMGFIIERGNEIVTEFENFESVNIPANHPARDIQDTFWVTYADDMSGLYSEKRSPLVLRTHTSSTQNRLLRTYGPEFSAIVPGRCYRNESIDASHDMAFFQVEGIMVGREISIANLVYFMKTALSAVFKRDIKVRLRPGFFPFTEPSFELDASCIFCSTNDSDGTVKGCSVCKHTGWVEFCGCGMIHPNVLQMGGVDPNKYQGFAFGFGLTRLAMMKYGVGDVRVFNSGDIETLQSIK